MMIHPPDEPGLPGGRQDPETKRMPALPRDMDMDAAKPRYVFALRAGMWACLSLILLTPYVVLGNTVFPYIVGKGLYSRLLIETLLVLWALLWLADVRYRPPRSAVLLLLAAGLATGSLSTVFGSSAQHSLWSNYERMQGLVDQAHWVAFAFVLAALLRTSREWRILFNLSLVASTGMAFLAIAQSQGLEEFLFGPLAKDFVRVATTFGNPLLLGAYAVVHALLAAGLLARSLAGGESRSGWFEQCWWGSAAALNLWTLSLSGARGALLGLLAALTVTAVLFLLMPSRSRRMKQAIMAALVFGGVSIAGAFTAVVLAGRDAGQLALEIPNPLARRLLTSALWGSDTVQTRLATWEAGWKGFLDRPVFGWGPENFISPFGRHVAGELGSRMKIHDNAHNRPIEELVTRGPLGLLAFLGAWLLAFAATARAARRAEPGDKILHLFAAGAISAYFVQQLLILLSVSGNLMMTLLFAFSARLEADLRKAKGETDRAPATRRTRAAVVAAAVAFGGAGGASNYGIWRGGTTFLDAVAAMEERRDPPPRVRAAWERAFAAFPPFANPPRVVFFEYAAKTWPGLRKTSAAEADRLLALAEEAAAKAIATEPENWWIHVEVAKLYQALAAADPSFAEEARFHFARAREMAPNRIAVGPDPSQGGGSPN